MRRIDASAPSPGAPRHPLPEGEGLAPSGPLPLGEGGPDADPERSEGEAEGPGEGKDRGRRRTILLPLLLLAALSARAADRPDLVVVISIDQFRADYLQHFRPWFSEQGFNRFLTAGATFPAAAYRHAVTFTGPGHAAIG